MRPGIAVVGTAPGVGTTRVTAGLALALLRRDVCVAVSKPIEIGCNITRDESRPTQVDGFPGELDAGARRAYERLNELVGPPPITMSTRTAPEALHPADAAWLLEMLGEAVAVRQLDEVNPHRFSADVTPAIAAELAERPIDFERLISDLTNLTTRCDLLVVDAGDGLFVPLDSTHLMVDLIAACGFAVLLVGPSERGVVSAVLLARAALVQRNLPLAGVVLDRLERRPRPEEAVNPHMIDVHAGDVVRGVLPFCDAAQRDDAALLGERFEVHVDVDGILAALGC